MGLFFKNRNDALICELKNELNSDILLFGTDGFVYFGHLQAIEDCRVAILTPAICACSCDVEIVTPGGCLVTVDYVRVDLCTIVAKGTGIVRDPVCQLTSCSSVCGDGACSAITEGCECDNGNGSGNSNCYANAASYPGNSGCNCRDEDAIKEKAEIFPGQERDYDCLNRQIKRQIGDNIALTSVGGFLFEGILSNVCNNLAIITIDEIFVPGCSGFISDCNLRSAVVNLDAISSVSGGKTRC